MQCKIDHTLEGAIPQALCVICSPRPATAAPATGWMGHVTNAEPAPAAGATGPDSHYDRKVKRALKAEVKAWRERVEAIERHTMAGPALKRARETLRKAETDLYMVL